MTDAGRARFRPIGPADSALVAALHRSCFKDAWTAAAVRILLEVRTTWGLLVYLNDGAGPEPVGYCLARGAADETEILSFGVNPGMRRRGFGRALLHAVVAKAHNRGVSRVCLEVADDNVAGRALYDRAGFVPVGRRPGYYRRSQTGRADAVVLCLDLATYTLTDEPINGK